MVGTVHATAALIIAVGKKVSRSECVSHNYVNSPVLVNEVQFGRGKW